MIPSFFGIQYTVIMPRSISRSFLYSNAQLTLCIGDSSSSNVLSEAPILTCTFLQSHRPFQYWCELRLPLLVLFHSLRYAVDHAGYLLCVRVAVRFYPVEGIHTELAHTAWNPESRCCGVVPHELSGFPEGIY